MKRLWGRLLTLVVIFLAGVGAVRLGTPARIEVTWETASEVDTAGFYLYRCAASERAFTPITEELIPARGDPMMGASYRYVDRDVRWGQRYVYQLEELERGGARNRFPNVIEARAGAGWVWALASGGAMTLLTGLLLWYGVPSPDG